MIIPSKLAVTMDELLQRLSILDRVEVVDGELVEVDIMTARFMHIHIISNLHNLLHPYVTKNRLGLYGGDGLTFVLEQTAEGVRRSRIPDSFFIKKSRIPKDWDIAKPFPTAPDLAIEVVSPNQDMEELQERIDDYFNFGTSQVWVFYPAGKTLHQYLDKNSIRIHRMGDNITVPELFPDFTLKIDDCFKLELPFDED